MINRNKSIEQHLTEVEALRQSVKELEGLEPIQGKRSKDRIWQQNEFASTVLESLTHPFYVVDAKDYRVKLANSAAAPGGTWQNRTCYAITHHRNKPCAGAEHPCPLQEVKKTKKPVIAEHIHYDKDDNARNVEVHCQPIFDSEGNVTQVIEYCLDITERKKTEEKLRETKD